MAMLNNQMVYINIYISGLRMDLRWFLSTIGGVNMNQFIFHANGRETNITTLMITWPPKWSIT